MAYAVHEIFFTLQGEGANSGRAAVFCRFSGCNLWTGREVDRASAICQFCDTDFVGTNGPGGGKFATAETVARTCHGLWKKHTDGSGTPFVVCTGGEPLLQLDQKLIDAFHHEGFMVAVETNGSIRAPAGLDWICVSPKARVELVQREGHELKLVFPQLGAPPELFQDLPFDHFFLQPMDGTDVARATRLSVDYCRLHPRWRLSVQMHKVVGIP
jgi:7-carboxy-7-deazaguanine synthase